MLQSAFPIVVFGAVALSVVMSLIFLFSRGSLYDHVGESGFAAEHDAGADAPGPAPGSTAERDEQEREVRQMLHARSARMVGRGEPALDIDAEVSRLLAPNPAPASAPAAARDPGIEREVRQLVLARNERRARQGLERLDVDAEVTRTLDELTP
ncbi:MAG TPA: hypothetical protein VGH09_03425 [Solirubrobacteraceae bacterium]